MIKRDARDMWLSGFVYGLIVSALLVGVMCLWAMPARSETNDQWLAIVAEIDRAIERADAQGRQLRYINAEDRQFVRKMANTLTADDNALPTPAQARWLRAIREWVRMPH